jgi:hypothetical protein
MKIACLRVPAMAVALGMVLAGTSTGQAAPREFSAAQDRQDFHTAVAAYRFWYPTVSMEAFFNGTRELGVADNSAVALLAAGPRHLVFTANSDTPYAVGTLDLKHGPIVVELPPGPYIAAVNDHHQRWIMDMGLPGPDEGKGGKHVIVPPGFPEPLPEGHFVGRSSSFKAFLAIRILPQQGDVKGAAEGLKRVKVYPLWSAASPEVMPFVDITPKKLDATPLRWEDNLRFWEVLHQVVSSEPAVEEFLPMYGLLSSLGIEKGKPFAPNDRMKRILVGAARLGRRQMLASAFGSVRPDRKPWDDRRWEWAGLVSDNGDFKITGGMDLTARERWFAQAILASPAMFRRKVGFGSVYWLAVRDGAGAPLDGGKTYRLRVPQPVPASLFWSVTAYDLRTRSQVVTEQDKAALRSMLDKFATNADGSVDLFFGPSAPEGREGQWIRTDPSRRWFAYFRIYGPRDAALDGSWKPGDFEEAHAPEVK